MNSQILQQPVILTCGSPGDEWRGTLDEFLKDNPAMDLNEIDAIAETLGNRQCWVGGGGGSALFLLMREDTPNPQRLLQMWYKANPPALFTMSKLVTAQQISVIYHQCTIQEWESFYASREFLDALRVSIERAAVVASILTGRKITASVSQPNQQEKI